MCGGCRNVVWPWFRDVSVLLHGGGYLSSVQANAFAATLSGNSGVCVLAAGTQDSVSLPVFTGDVRVLVGDAASGAPCAVNESTTNSSQVCVTLPTLAEVCNNNTLCMQRGTCMAVCLLTHKYMHSHLPAAWY